MWYLIIKQKIFTFNDGQIVEYDTDRSITYCGDLMMVGFTFE